ncbi:replication protein P [Aeromonas veronii]|uniref:replication protein P n=1 Tax=Aeromonas veronii TaxID=654 RepID=UPI003D1D521D
MKPLSEVLAGMPSELPVAPVRKVAAVVTERDTLVVSKLLEQLKVIFPAWQRSFPAPKMQDQALREWTIALVEANCTSREQLSLGMRVARSQEIPFFPGPGMFIKWCEITPEAMGLPSLDTALVEVRTRRYTHPAVELAAKATSWERQTLSLDEYRPVFEQAYAQLLRRVVAGEDLGAEVRKGLPTREQVQHSPEYYQQAGQRGVESLKALFKRGGMANVQS